MVRKEVLQIKDIIQDFFKKNPELYDSILEIRIKRAWVAVLGSGIQNYTTSLFLRRNVLYVSIKSSVLRQELLLNSNQIIKQLNQYAGAKVVERIIIH